LTRVGQADASLVQGDVGHVGCGEEDQLVIGPGAGCVGFGWITPLRALGEDIVWHSEPEIAEDDHEHKDHEKIQARRHSQRRETRQPTVLYLAV
jgi:hypothetical protein